MKKLLVILAFVLSGCSLWTQRAYDPVEYSMAVSIAADATRAIHNCDSDARLVYTQRLGNTSFVLVEYMQNKRDSAAQSEAALLLRRMVQDFNAETSTSIRYCVHKLASVQAAARMLASGIALTDQFDLCSGDVTTRYKAFEASYTSGVLSQHEFTELTNDLLRLKTIDTSSCSLERRRQLNEALDLISKAVSVL